MIEFSFAELCSLPRAECALVQWMMAEAFVVADEPEAWKALAAADETLHCTTVHTPSAGLLTENQHRALAVGQIVDVVADGSEHAGELLVAAYQLAVRFALMRTHPVWEELN